VAPHVAKSHSDFLLSPVPSRVFPTKLSPFICVFHFALLFPHFFFFLAPTMRRLTGSLCPVFLSCPVTTHHTSFVCSKIQLSFSFSPIFFFFPFQRSFPIKRKVGVNSFPFLDEDTQVLPPHEAGKYLFVFPCDDAGFFLSLFFVHSLTFIVEGLSSYSPLAETSVTTSVFLSFLLPWIVSSLFSFPWAERS